MMTACGQRAPPELLRGLPDSQVAGAILSSPTQISILQTLKLDQSHQDSL